MQDKQIVHQKSQSCDVREILNIGELTTDDWVGMVNDLLVTNHGLRNQLAESNQEAQKWRTQYDLLLDGEGTPTDNLLKHIAKDLAIIPPSQPPAAIVTWLNEEVKEELKRGAAA